MPRTASEDLDLEQAIRGLLALQVAEREERLSTVTKPARTEVILATAGLSYGAIASVTGKKRDTVRKTIERARDEDGNG